MTDVSLAFRHRAFAIAREVRRRTGQVEPFALAWTTEDAVIARMRRGRRFEYRAFPMDGDDTQVIEAIAEWVHADSPRTS